MNPEKVPPRTSPSQPRRLDWRIVLGITLVVLVGPLFVDLVVSGPARAFGSVAPDTFYYLVYAQRSLDSHIVGFDGQHWSNGFHPLWMALVTLLHAVQPNAGTYVDLYWLLGLGVLLHAFAFYFLAKALRHPDGSLSAWFIALPVGVYALLVSPAWLSLSPSELKEQDPWSGSEPVYGTAWSFVNGMETSLVLCAYAALFFAYCALRPLEKRAHAVGFGVLLALLVFARLDHAFIALPILAFACLREKPWASPRAAFSCALVAGVFLGLLFAYLAINNTLFGSAMPVSGRIKSTYPQVTVDNFNTLVAVHSFLVGGHRPPIYLFWRVFQVVIPVAVALVAPAALLSVRRVRGHLLCAWAKPTQASQFLAATGLGVLGLAAYDFLYVPTSHMGHWYFPVSVLFVSLVSLSAFERVRACAEKPLPATALRSFPTAALPSIALATLLAGASVAFYVKLHRHEDYNGRYAKFYLEERTKLRDKFTGEPHLFCFDDGIVAYVTGFPTMSATGLALDARAIKSLRQGRLLELALTRGFDHLTSLVYVDHSALRGKKPDLAAWARGAHFFGKLDDKTLEVAYVSENMNFAIVKAQTKTGPRQ